MDWFLKWFYGYKNFWDEMLFFWLVNRIEENYSINKLVVEAGDVERFSHRIRENKSFLGPILDKLEIVPIDVYKWKYIHHIMNILWLGKYKHYFKFFWWWEVLDESRKIPHDGWNIPTLYNYSVRKKKFVLLWWIGTHKKRHTNWLFSYLIPKAESIICREKVSKERAILFGNKTKTLLYEDFSLAVLREAEAFLHQQESKEEYMLININDATWSEENIKKIVKFVEKYPGKKIFFPGQIEEDKKYYAQLKSYIHDLNIYDRTKHNLNETIAMLYNAKAGVWARLHFLYPLKVFWKPYMSLSHSDKIEKLIS